MSGASGGVRWRDHAFWITAITWFVAWMVLILFGITWAADIFPQQAEFVGQVTNGMPVWLGLPLAVITFVSPLWTAVLAAWLVDRWLRGPGDQSTALPPSLARAAQSFQADANTLAQLRLQVDAQLDRLEQLRATSSEHERLAALRRDEAAAVQRLVESAVESAHATLARSNRKEQMIFFVLGVAVSIPISLVTNIVTK